MRQQGLGRRLREGFWAHERGLARACLGFLALAALTWTLPAVRAPVLDALEAGVRAWDARWSDAVTHGEQLVAQGRYAEAALYLERLDRRFPARTAKHRRERERARLLRALASSYAALGRKRHALDAAARLVAFDPRAYAHHVLRAELARRFGDKEVALAAYRAALAIHPTHLPALRGEIELLFERGDHAGVVAAYERYLGALRIRWVDLVLGERSVHRPLLADGRWHTLEFTLTAALAAGPGRELRLRPGAGPLDAGEVEIQPPLRVGAVPTGERSQPLRFPGSRWRVRHGRMLAPARFWLDDAGAELRLPLPAGAVEGAAVVRVRLRERRPIDPALWREVERSYRDRLASAALVEAQERSVITSAVAPHPEE